MTFFEIFKKYHITAQAARRRAREACKPKPASEAVWGNQRSPPGGREPYLRREAVWRKPDGTSRLTTIAVDPLPAGREVSEVK